MLRRIALHLIVCVFLLITGNALALSLGFSTVLLFPTFVHHSHGMMTVFQNYVTTTTAPIAEGKLPNGTWEQVDVTRYFPFSRGELSKRFWTMSFTANAQEMFRRVAEAILRHERNRGKPYEALRIVWEEWPSSAESYDTLRFGNNIKRYPITDVSMP